MIEIRVDTSGIYDAFVALVKGLRNTSPLMQEVAHVMNIAVSENFERGGRPKWLGKRDGTPSKLQDTGRLKSSITRVFDENTAIVGTNVAYAAIHHFGGKIKHPGGTRYVITKGGMAAFVSNSFSGPVHGVTKPHTIQMPARPFLQLEADDLQEIELIGQRYLQGLVE